MRTCLVLSILFLAQGCCSLAKESSGPVHDAWANHFSAFGTQDVKKILKDYTEDSVITVYNQVDGSMKIFKGLSDVEDCFTGLFKSLFDTSDLKAPVQVVKEASDSEPGSVFLIWSAGKSGYAEATDTFAFDSKGKIVKQNVVVTYKDPKSKHKSDVKPASVAPKPDEKGIVHKAWANHFSAFGGQDVDKILKDYTDSSIITVYNQADGSKTVFKGLDDVKKCFTGLFKSLFDTIDLAAPVQIVKEAPKKGFGGVFLIWSAGASGYKTATDTFIIDDKGKIQRQNVVVHYEKPSKKKEEKYSVEPQIRFKPRASAMWLPVAGLATLFSVSLAVGIFYRRQLQESTLAEEAEHFDLE